MHRRSEDEIQAAQELKNYQDFVYETNTKLQSLEVLLNQYSLMNEKILNSFQAQKKEFEIQVENLEQKYESRLESLYRRVDQHVFSTNASIEIIEKNIKSICGDLVGITHCNDAIEKLETKHEELSKDSKKSYSAIVSDLQIIRHLILSSVDGLRKEVASKPSEIPPLEKTIANFISEMKVNFVGLNREINLIKRSIEYGEKKFENLYTLIERLKAGKE